MFMTAVDQYVLKDGTDGADPSAFDAIGTDAERAPLILASLLSYEEMQISALLGCASQCHFINRGGRGNQGEAGDRYGETHEPRGVYVGQVGCRFERPLRMEWCHMVIDPAQNIRSEGYGAASGTGAGTVPLAEAAKRAMLTRWAQLYRLAEQEGGWVVGGAPGHDSARLVAPPPAAATLASPDRRGLNFPLHSEVEAWWDADAPGARARWALLRCGDGRVRRFLDLAALRGRCRILAESFLLEANTRAAEASRREGREVRAYCHAVGLGLGVWQIAPEQRFVLVDAFAAAVEACDLPFVSDIDFAWMQDSRSGAPTSCGSAAAGTTLSSRVYLRNAVDFRFSKRDPAEPLAGRHAGKLLVAQFAWDSNACVVAEPFLCHSPPFEKKGLLSGVLLSMMAGFCVCVCICLCLRAFCLAPFAFCLRLLPFAFCLRLCVCE